MAMLKVLRYETRYIAEFIDDWFATNLRSYTNTDLSARLSEIGFDTPSLLAYGMDYDSSHRRNMYTDEEERDLMGEGDLRYLLTKVRHEQGNEHLLDEGEYGSSYIWPAGVSETIDSLMEHVKQITDGRNWLRIAVVAHIQRELRLLLTEKKLFSLNEIAIIVNDVLRNAETARSLG